MVTSNRSHPLINTSFKTFWVCVLFAASVLTYSFSTLKSTPEQQVVLHLKLHLDSLEREMVAMEAATASAPEEIIRGHFHRSRTYYKQVEYLVEYFFPGSAQRVNGPALVEADPYEPAEPKHPTGFQVLEEIVYQVPDEQKRMLMRTEVSTLLYHVRAVRDFSTALQPDAALVFDALRLNLYRLLAKGITGFDAPVSLSSVPEAGVTLRSMKQILGYYQAPDALIQQLEDAISFVGQQDDFDSFDRASFLKDHLHPLMQALNQFRSSRGIPLVRVPRAVRPEAGSIFDLNAWDPGFYAPDAEPARNKEQLVALGKKLFSERMLSAGKNRSCASCHQPELAFTDGLALNSSLSEKGRLLMRNTPSLYNTGLQPVQFADSRVVYLEDQIHDVVGNDEEMNGDFEVILGRLRNSRDYRNGFTAAFGSESGISRQQVRTAIATYVRSILSLNSRFDQYVRGNANALNTAEIKGLNLFMGKAKCGTCHFAPLFTGSVPPLFEKMESEVLGVPASRDTLNAVLDTDSGKYHLYGMDHHLHSFKTPTVRNVGLTAPYMHNGVFNTLEEVMEFYNRGGGAGLGFELPNQTLPPDRLNLSSEEQAAIIAFMQALTDTGKEETP